ncbi:hypothetical protein IEO21_06512 [Rhodonia placenta]|uniref:Uncharacterized protein n=1 Tax=Rhodonia placenta TaxID=104341 RepID=A0A8H7NZX7_9APHY|nr:hypothetical protein IEO21_06512 [Postia placenta]
MRVQCVAKQIGTLGCPISWRRLSASKLSYGFRSGGKWVVLFVMCYLRPSTFRLT